MISPPLPDPVFSVLERLACGLEEGLEAEGHTVGLAVGANQSFNRSWLETDLCRAVIAGLVRPLGGDTFQVEDLGTGGVEITHVHEGIERRFRLKKATRNGRGELVVIVNSDSILTSAVPKGPSLFDDEATRNAPPPKVQQWVLAYILDPHTHTFLEVSAASVTGKKGNTPPYRLRFGDIVRIPHTAPLPPDFQPDEDDLDLGHEDDERGEEAG